MNFFEICFLPEAKDFVGSLEPKAVKKLFYNIDMAQQTNDPRLFKKLNKDIWEFRLLFAGLQIRLLAFWDKANPGETLVIATHGFFKKTDKVPVNEIARAEHIMKRYFEFKSKK